MAEDLSGEWGGRLESLRLRETLLFARAKRSKKFSKDFIFLDSCDCGFRQVRGFSSTKLRNKTWSLLSS